MAALKFQPLKSMSPDDMYVGGGKVPPTAKGGPIDGFSFPFDFWQKDRSKYGWSLASCFRFYDDETEDQFDVIYPVGNLAQREGRDDVVFAPWDTKKNRAVVLPEMRVEMEDGYKLKVFIDAFDDLDLETVMEKYRGDGIAFAGGKDPSKAGIDIKSRWGEFLNRAILEGKYSKDIIKAANCNVFKIGTGMYGEWAMVPTRNPSKKKQADNNKREEIFILTNSMPRPNNFGPGNTAAEDGTEETAVTTTKPVSRPAKAAGKGSEAPTDTADIKPIIIAAVDAKLAVAPKGAGALKSTVAVAMNEHYGEGQWDADEAMAMLTKLLASGRWKKNEADKYMPTPADIDDADEDETEEDD